MLEKNQFIKLELDEQKRLRTFMILLTASFIIWDLFQLPSLSFLLLLSFAYFILFLYFSIYLVKAPSFYFRSIIPLFWVVLISGSFNSVIGLGTLQFSAPGTYFGLFGLLLAIFYWKSLMIYRKAIIAAKKTNSPESVEDRQSILKQAEAMEMKAVTIWQAIAIGIVIGISATALFFTFCNPFILVILINIFGRLAIAVWLTLMSISGALSAFRKRMYSWQMTAYVSAFAAGIAIVLTYLFYFLIPK
mgnify:CR=1 FL=1